MLGIRQSIVEVGSHGARAIAQIIDIATVEIMTELPKLVRILAQHSGQLVNYSKLGSAIGISYKTAQRCMALLEKLFLMSTLQPWHTNALKRIVKNPKLHFVDSGLLSTVRGSGFNRIKSDRVQLGAPLESFVHSELAKLIGADDMQWSIYHFRDQQLREVDFVLERDDGLIADIEVKASATVGHRDFAGLISLSSACKERFAASIVLYDGDVFVPFGNDMAAVPISALWA